MNVNHEDWKSAKNARSQGSKPDVGSIDTTESASKHLARPVWDLPHYAKGQPLNRWSCLSKASGSIILWEATSAVDWLPTQGLQLSFRCGS